MSETNAGFVSTGTLPTPDEVRRAVDDALVRFRTGAEGSLSDVYPALAAVDPSLFGLAVVGTGGRVWEAGDARHPFAIMSVAKPFVFALVHHALGGEVVRERVGVNATGLSFNDPEAVRRGHGVTNPMVNPGAIATVSLVPGPDREGRWLAIRDGLGAFAGRDLSLDEAVYRSVSATNHGNRELAALLARYGRLEGDPAEALDLYTRQSCLKVTAVDLAVMGATLADGGVNPVARARVVDAEACHDTLAVMITAGLYETSGDWLYDVGLPGKSGIGGGIVTVAPGKGGLGTFAPLLDAAGNSVKGQLTARYLARRLGLGILRSAPDAATSSCRSRPGAVHLDADASRRSTTSCDDSPAHEERRRLRGRTSACDRHGRDR
jgi:glutaminase